jgi:hypothetical protein
MSSRRKLRMANGTGGAPDCADAAVCTFGPLEGVDPPGGGGGGVDPGVGAGEAGPVGSIGRSS